MIELRIDQVKKHPADFMYLWATDSFLSELEYKSRTIIKVKRANQRKLITLSAMEYINKDAEYNGAEYKQYTDAIYSAFQSAYGVTPEKALDILASGGSVAGKNWKEGIYGIGSVSKSFADSDVTVDSKTGYMMRDGKYLSVYDTVYDDKKGQKKTGVYQQSYYDEKTGKTYISQYNKALGKFYAQSYSTSDGTEYSASGKERLSASDNATIWSSVILSLQSFIEWIINLFGSGNKTTINSTNTLPSQTKDGFVSEAGFGTWGVILLALVAGGMLMREIKKKKSN